jgi:hypothetical protein
LLLSCYCLVTIQDQQLKLLVQGHHLLRQVDPCHVNMHLMLEVMFGAQLKGLPVDNP